MLDGFGCWCWEDGPPIFFGFHICLTSFGKNRGWYRNIQYFLNKANTFSGNGLTLSVGQKVDVEINWMLENGFRVQMEQLGDEGNWDVGTRNV